jgi:hypothetical protein
MVIPLRPYRFLPLRHPRSLREPVFVRRQATAYDEPRAHRMGLSGDSPSQEVTLCNKYGCHVVLASSGW